MRGRQLQALARPGRLLKDADGRPLEFAGTLTDISEQRSLESQLVQAQKMDAIGKLTGGIAHDFNNLLAAVIGGLGLLESAPSSATSSKILTMTKRAAEQGGELVRRLLAFARRQKLEPQRSISPRFRRRSRTPRHTRSAAW